MTASAGPSGSSGETVTASLTLDGPDWLMQLKVTVPTSSITVLDLLPLAQSLADSVVRATVENEVAEGRSISCCAGCGACCRQLVPISAVEAHRIRELVESLPEPRKSQILERFAAARQRLEQSGMLDILRRPASWPEQGYDSIGLRYFRLKIPCPFLEDESCSIYPDRPLACREYLVTSPAENCADPNPRNIDLVRMPVRFSPALARFRHLEEASDLVRWVPLILALEWAAADSVPPASRPGPEMLSELVQHVTGGNAPPPPER